MLRAIRICRFTSAFRMGKSLNIVRRQLPEVAIYSVCGFMEHIGRRGKLTAGYARKPYGHDADEVAKYRLIITILVVYSARRVEVLAKMDPRVYRQRLELSRKCFLAGQRQSRLVPHFVAINSWTPLPSVYPLAQRRILRAANCS